MDLDESGRIGFEELEGVTRARDPGLNLDEAALSLADLRSFWKALDADRSGDITVDEFMLFTKRHGPQMHRLTEYSQQLRSGVRSTAARREGCW